MRHYYRTHISPDAVLSLADEYFKALKLERKSSESRSREYSGLLGTLALTVGPEGGHYTRIEANTNQMGESRLDRNVKRFFVNVHRAADPSHALRAAY
ncbi:MAG: hypothetical protein H7Z74_12140 [Anaerolineae bacterium]|nr:hypothetical protein [Gemmatimonadaceae bacterium]